MWAFDGLFYFVTMKPGLPRLTSALWIVEMRSVSLQSSLGLSVQTDNTIRRNDLCRIRVVHV